MASMNSISVYAGSREDGPRLETRLDNMVRRRGGKIKSRSELVREYIDRGLIEDEKLYPPLPDSTPTVEQKQPTAAAA